MTEPRRIGPIVREEADRLRTDWFEKLMHDGRCSAWLRLGHLICDLEEGHTGDHQFNYPEEVITWSGTDDDLTIRVTAREYEDAA